MQMVTLKLSVPEYVLLASALREVATGIPDRELRTRVGGTAAELIALGNAIRTQATQQETNG